MGASIIWRPVKKGCSIDCDTPSSFVETMQKVFDGEDAWRLGEPHLQKLQVLRDITTSHPNPYEQICELISKHGTIEVSAEW